MLAHAQKFPSLGSNVAADSDPQIQVSKSLSIYRYVANYISLRN